jgi:hypothetical protein
MMPKQAASISKIFQTKPKLMVNEAQKISSINQELQQITHWKAQFHCSLK